jgi:membrane-bound ClpP family serine protease
VGQVIQVVGSIMILIGFGFAQTGRLDQKSPAYLILNFVGSALLAAEALAEQQWGFLLLEGSWAAVSLVSIVQVYGTGRLSGGAR